MTDVPSTASSTIASPMREVREKKLLWRIVPYLVGFAVYFFVRATKFIPKDRSVFPSFKSESFLSGLVDGLGNIRNLVAASVGAFAGIVTSYFIPSRPKAERLAEKPIFPESLAPGDEEMYAKNSDYRKRIENEKDLGRSLS